MKERIIEFLKAENKSSAQFAEDIGVQPSGISHILSGRNKPSLDFIIKMLEKYTFLSTEWLIFGKGTMYKDNLLQTLFDEPNPNKAPINSTISQKDVNRRSEPVDNEKDISGTPDNLSLKGRNSLVRRIVWFFDDNSYEEFYPRL
jgi:transcriptional regulator with XRE-family HTH domain